MAFEDPDQKILIVINSTSKVNSCCKNMNDCINQLQTELGLVNCQMRLYQVKSILDTFNYKGGSYPEIIGNIYWLPFVIKTTVSIWSDIENGIDRRSEIEILNGKFDGRGYVKHNQYIGTQDLQSQYIDFCDIAKIVLWTQS